jgi:hypothetical protein
MYRDAETCMVHGHGVMVMDREEEQKQIEEHKRTDVRRTWMEREG